MGAEIHMEALVGKHNFIGLEQCTWLYSGAEGPVHKGCAEQVASYLDNRSKGPGGRENNARIEAECKQYIAELLQAQPSDIAFMANSSDVISEIAMAMDLTAGDNVVINALEFPSGVLPWLRLKENGIEVRVVRHSNWTVTPDDILGEVDERTRLVITSHVSYQSGARLDYSGLYERLKRTDTLLLLDATQSLGIMPVSLREADFVVCSSYKWLLSLHGLGILGVNPERTRQVRPVGIGWRSTKELFHAKRFETFEFWDDARRFETGFPSYPTLYALHYSARLLLETGIDRIRQHILELGGELIERLEHAGYELMTPREPTQRAGNISIVHPEGEQAADRLRERQIYVWGGDNRLRVSIHLFNDTADLDRLMEALR